LKGWTAFICLSGLLGFDKIETTWRVQGAAVAGIFLMEAHTGVVCGGSFHMKSRQAGACLWILGELTLKRVLAVFFISSGRSTPPENEIPGWKCLKKLQLLSLFSA